MPDWNRDFLGRLPLFEPLRVHGAHVETADWPSLSVLQAALDARGAVSGGGKPLRVVAQGALRARVFEDRYEPRLYLKGELAVREQNWHDLFNVLVWLNFPRAKAAINARHYRALVEQRREQQREPRREPQPHGTANRGPAQDALTLFDEGGVIVASSEPGLLDALRAFEWKRLFWQERKRVEQHMRWLLFGHAIYEKALEPFVGITGRGVLFEVAPAFHRLPLQAQLLEFDTRLAARIADQGSFNATRELAPVPILGVPGWWPANSAEAFYDNTDYFRPGRARKASAGRAVARWATET